MVVSATRRSAALGVRAIKRGAERDAVRAAEVGLAGSRRANSVYQVIALHVVRASAVRSRSVARTLAAADGCLLGLALLELGLNRHRNGYIAARDQATTTARGLPVRAAGAP